MAQSLGEAVFDLKLEDSAFQAGLQKANNNIRTFTDSTGRLRDEFGRFIPQQKAAAAGLEQFGNNVNASGAGMKGLVGQLASLGLQLGVAAAAAKAFNLAQEAEKASQAVKTLGVNAVQLNSSLKLVSAELRGQASTLELTQAAYDVASAGFNKAADATQILKAAAQGAKGGFSDINTVADAATSVLNAYGKSAGEASKIIDGFITTQNDGKIVVDQYAQQIGKVAPIAAAAGVSIEELNAAVSAATAQGVPVEATFAGLRQTLASILKPTKEAGDLAEALGINFNASALKAKGLGQFLTEVSQKTKGSAEANAVLFGSVEALTAVQPLLNDQLAKYNQFLTNQQNNAGAAASAAAITSDTISSGVQAIGNALSNLVTSTSFSGLGSTLAGLADFINNISLNPVEQQIVGVNQAVTLLEQQITEQKEFGLDTTNAENRLEDLRKRAEQLKGILGEQTRVEELKQQAIELSKQAEQLERAGLKAEGLKAQIGAIGNEIAALQGQNISFNLPNGNQVVGQVLGPLKQLSAEARAAQLELEKLQTQRAVITPGVDTTQLDQQIQQAKQRVDATQARIRVAAETQAVDVQIQRIQAELAKPLAVRLDPAQAKQFEEELQRLKERKQILEQSTQAQTASTQQQITATQGQTAALGEQLNVQALLNAEKKKEAEDVKTASQLLDEELTKRKEGQEAAKASTTAQQTLNREVLNTTANTQAAAAGAQALKQELQGAATAKQSLSQQFDAQVKVALEGSEVFRTMNGYLQTIAANSSKPTPVNVTVTAPPQEVAPAAPAINVAAEIDNSTVLNNLKNFMQTVAANSSKPTPVNVTVTAPEQAAAPIINVAAEIDNSVALRNVNNYLQTIATNSSKPVQVTVKGGDSYQPRYYSSNSPARA